MFPFDDDPMRLESKRQKTINGSDIRNSNRVPVESILFERISRNKERTLHSRWKDQPKQG
jgi:hypothetical protein